MSNLLKRMHTYDILIKIVNCPQNNVTLITHIQKSLVGSVFYTWTHSSTVGIQLELRQSFSAVDIMTVLCLFSEHCC